MARGQGVVAARSAIAVSALAVALAGCSSGGVEPSSASSGGSGFRDRMNKLFFGSPAEEAQALAANTADAVQDCPVADVRTGASTMRIPQAADTTASSLRYQATISRLARECAVRGPLMTIKVGVQGRVIVGPAGGPGQIEVPLRYAVVHEGPEPKTILTKLHRFPVSLNEGQGSTPFLHVEEDISFTVPARYQLENYVVYVGFDPAAVRESQPARKSRSR
jgi:hypothetical protein